jgi:hypothetical protein
MPIINITLPETVESVSRPIIYAVLSHLRSVLAIEPNVQVIFPGDLHKMAQAGSTIDNPLRSPNLANDRYLFIEVDAQMDPYALATTAVNQAEHPLVFNDSKLQVHLAPIYATTDVSLNVKYRTPSRTEALRWQDDLRVRLSQMQDIHLHKIQYHYQLPDAYWEILECIHTTREQIAGYGDSLTDYIKQHSSDRLTLISDVAGQTPRLAIAETQSRIQGRYAFDGIPEKPEREDNGTYTATLSYKFSYERPISAWMRYPIMVHNQLLPPEYVLFTTSNTNANAAPQLYSQSLAALSHFEAINQGINQANLQGFLSIPLYDQFVRPTEVPYTGTVFYALCSIDMTDQRTLVNFRELGDVEIDSDILQFIQESEYPYMHKLYKSVLQIHLYRDKTLAHYDSIQCDSQLDIKATYDLDYRIPHRVRFSIVTDWSVLDPDALARLRRYPKVLLKILRAINELFDENPYLLHILGNRPRYSESELRALLDPNGRFTDEGLLKLLSRPGLITDKDLDKLLNYLYDKNANLFGPGSFRGHNVDLLREGHLGRSQFNSVCVSYIVSISHRLDGQVTDAMIQ